MPLLSIHFYRYNYYTLLEINWTFWYAHCKIGKVAKINVATIHFQFDRNQTRARLVTRNRFCWQDTQRTGGCLQVSGTVRRTSSKWELERVRLKESRRTEPAESPSKGWNAFKSKFESFCQVATPRASQLFLIRHENKNTVVCCLILWFWKSSKF